MAMPTIEQIVSRYLFNQNSPPADLKDEKLIRPMGAMGDAVVVNRYEYMTTGGGRFAGIERFNFIRNFLGAHDESYASMSGSNLAEGAYTLQEILAHYGIDPGDSKLAVSQYYSGVNDGDFAERAYVFGSTEFKINDDAMFYVNHDGSREIVGAYVEPAVSCGPVGGRAEAVWPGVLKRISLQLFPRLRSRDWTLC